MEPISPVLAPEFAGLETVYAKDQPEYTPLPTLKSPLGIVLTRWHLTEQEREAIEAGADILLMIHTFNQPLPPIRIEVTGCDRDLVAVAGIMGLLDESAGSPEADHESA